MLSVSLIIPNRNNARFLPQCIESALAQTRPFAEIVIVDDCSDDDSVQVIEAYRRRHSQLRLIRLTRNVGVSAARNRGIRASSSAFVTLLDADDYYWNEKKNECEMRLIEAALPCDTVAAFSDIMLVTAEGDRMFPLSAQTQIREGRIFNPLLYLDCLVPRDFVFSRRAFEATDGFDHGSSLYEDWDFKLRLARVCEFRYTGESGVAYRQNPAGLSRAPLRQHVGAMRRVVWRNTAELGWPHRAAIRCRAMIGVFKFLRGGFRAWLKQLILPRRGSGG